MARAPEERDAAAIAEVVKAHDIADYGEPDFTHEDLLDDWMRPRFALAHDAWVLTGPTGRIIGYAYVWESQPDFELEADAFVLPEYSGRGLGGQLLELIESRAHEVCAGRPMTLGIFASGANDDKRYLLERRGFSFVRSVLRMRIDLNRDPVEPIAHARRRRDRSDGPRRPRRRARGLARRVLRARALLAPADGRVVGVAVRAPGIRPVALAGRDRRRRGRGRGVGVRRRRHRLHVNGRGTRPRRGARASARRWSRPRSRRSGTGARCGSSSRSTPTTPACSVSTRRSGMRVHERHDLFVKPVS